MKDTLVNKILEHGQNLSDKPALALKQRTVNYKELAESTRGIAAVLFDKGVKRGDRLVLTCPSKIETIQLFLAIQYIGAIGVYADKNASQSSIEYLYKDTDARFLITDKKYDTENNGIKIITAKSVCDPETWKDLTPPAYIEPEESEVAELIYTSGTTGNAKGVMRTYKVLNGLTHAIIGDKGITGDDRVLEPMPLNHAAAVDEVIVTLYVGGLVVLQNGFIFTNDVQKNIEQYDCTILGAVPAALETLLSEYGDRFGEVLGRLRCLTCGTSTFSVALQKEVVKRLPNTNVSSGWGSSETASALSYSVSEYLKEGEGKISGTIPPLGRPLKEVEVRILDENGGIINDSSEEKPGRMAIRSSYIMAGYWNKEELTGETIRDGWVLTSDLVFRGDDGMIFYMGRIDDIINVGGEKASPVEIETVADTFPEVAESACIGVDDPEKKLGKVPVLFVVPQNGVFSEAALKRYLADRLERYKVPVAYIPLTELPRNAMKKLNRNELRKIWENRNEKPGEDLPENNPVIQALLTRRSIRTYTDREISRELLDLIVKTGYYAPTGHNMQTWQFYVLQGKEKISRLKDTISETVKNVGGIFYGFENPNVVIIVTNDVRNEGALADSSAAMENMLLAAHALGLGGVWIGVLTGLRDREPVKSLLDEYGIAENHVVSGIINLGYPASKGHLLAKKTDVVHYI